MLERNRVHVGFWTLLLFVLLLSTSWTATAQEIDTLEWCRSGAFSTEEDFISHGPVPFDGNRYISDGDLLSFDGRVCARNAWLARQFDVVQDLGLDAVDILDFERGIVAFSTELDSPHGNFTAGDVLFTPGFRIPNQALVAPFQISFNIGLDGLHFVGSDENLRRFIDIATGTPPDDWLGGKLQGVLHELNIDIWFSVEGTAPYLRNSLILDGDVLSARHGIVLPHQSQLLSPPTPAGIPMRGVDFGLDGLTGRREPDRRSLLFSTEILYDGESSFTDGDVLRYGGAIVFHNEDLVAPFEPAARFLGVDAIHIAFREPVYDPNIQTMCGDDHLVADFEGGVASIGSVNPAFTGLYRNATDPDFRQPCGQYVPFDGFLPDSEVKRFRVVVREIAEAVPAVGTGTGIQTTWQIANWDPWLGACSYNPAVALTLQTDPDGWMEALPYLEAKTGFDVDGDGVRFSNACVNAGLRLAVWDTLSLPAGPAAGRDREDHYVVWLEWEDSAGLHREPVDHHIQLDNTRPVVSGLEMQLPDEGKVVQACGEAPAGASVFEVWGEFSDDHYLAFSLYVRGGSPPATVTYGPHYHFDADDGSGFKNTDATGTVGSGLVHLRDIDMQDLGESFTDCCYILELYVDDSTIRHSFNHRLAWYIGTWPGIPYPRFITFAAAP
ncbi:MAG: hypothetical protein IPK19_41635 [Chloroflexi bacterium]|nr:hypothetical protein [Chloroflexota bacterium]